MSLKKLGLRIQLGHNPSDCSLDFCECTTAQICYKQLLHARLYPATTTDPRTAATFGVLEHYHLLSFELKVSTYKFYHNLARRSDNTGLTPIKDRYAPFMHIVHEWRHLRQLQCAVASSCPTAGRGHDPNGVGATQEGELAVMCPACPQPEMNLPAGWENSEPNVKWCYVLFIAMDANFRLKRKAVLSDQVDPGLNAGWGYFVEEQQYKSYLSHCMTEQQERSTCVSHNAINMADTKSSQGLAATGVGTVDCARHDMKRPNGVGDLQKGEKYLNMDYLMLSTLANSSVPVLNVSYNIACQWSKKFWNWMEAMPTHLHLPRDNLNIHYSVLKFHIGAHIEECQIAYSWNFGKFVGWTDGEAPERGWANINRVASSTKEMGPGTRRDTLDDYFGDWNWKKITALGMSISIHFCYQLTDSQTLILEWRSEIEAWEDDSTSPNSFQSRVISVMLAGVHSQLADLEASELQVGINCSLHCDISPSILISTGIDIEEQQQRLHCDIANLSLHPTDKQKEMLTHCTNTLQCKIDTWTRVQELYMPIVSTLRSSHLNPAAPTELKPQDFLLYLPSALDDTLHCDKQLRDNEWELCYAQALDALKKFKEKNLRGQAASMHAQALIAQVEARKDARMGTLSWIWVAHQADNSCTENDKVQDCIHIEWCKARARAARWSEEVDLLLEEMRRVLVYLEWEIEAWRSRATRHQINKLPEQ
ncbi:uncharacterized protein HD556DRAFT_1430245 [Suillus plorans]|uniref:CxC2-like cysteine cluster KDZ transposase-associated domain-containing protein n=1 Tax=Suillus plorans TaxID=116603 RepID=A0A9P7J3I7_9AGAM|nr:uncharacterized protein HD556DRAFT_1430245 [Suillus plorans]KAG1800908.1 hypothetical protein HD556DRAFT_1430245 [Suillus plorans]